MALVPFTPSNPHTTTRADFTANILSVTIPESADKDWANGVRHQQGLYRVLFDHEAMARNRQQTFMTPAAHKTAIYHLWDFVGRTLQYFYMVDCERAWSARKGQDKQLFDDAMSRKAMSRIMVEDTSGKSDMMLNTNVDARVPFDDAIKQAAAVEGQ